MPGDDQGYEASSESIYPAAELVSDPGHISRRATSLEVQRRVTAHTTNLSQFYGTLELRLIRRALFDLGFFEFDVLARDRIVFFENQLFRRCTRVLLRHVEEAGTSRRQQLIFCVTGLAMT